jgi:pimeloyl-ACP methyl ester carboxylesterase
LALAVVTSWLVACLGTPPGTPTPGAQSAPPVASTMSPMAPVDATPQSGTDQVAFESVPCPDTVTIVMVVVPACGMLVVPEQREEALGDMIRVFVIRIEPTDGTAAGDPVVVVGETLGNNNEYGGLAQIAQRTGRTVFLVDRRGTGLSEPSLACPEIEALGPSILEEPTAPTLPDELLEAIDACHARLTGIGIDLGAYGLRDSALDIEDLRVSLGIPEWNLIAFGTSSRLALEAARLHPEGVRSLVLDSPVLPQGPDPMFNVAAAQAAVDQVDALCDAALGCAGGPGQFAAQLEATIARLSEDPLSIETLARDGSQRKVTLDGTRFARATRNILAAEGAQLIPGFVASVVDGGPPNDALVALVERDEGLCLGYLPECGRIVHGSVLTTVCADVMPFVDPSALPGAAGGAGVEQAFVGNPFAEACEHWPTTAADSSQIEPIDGDFPVLMMTGQFDSFTGPIEAVQAGSSGLVNALYFEVPNQTYNMFGYNACPRLVRRAWLDDPAAAPDTSCFAEIAPPQLGQ